MDTRRRTSPPGTVFVGRDWELAELRTGLEDARMGRGRLFVVSGEAGIGKTRLARSLAELAESEQVRVLWGRCWEGEEAPAFWPWIQVFRNLAFAVHAERDATRAGADASEGPELAGLLAGDAGAPPPQLSEQARFRLFDQAAQFLRSAARGRPLVLILEDLHEADRSSLLLLDFVARQLQDIPLMVLATHRDPDAGLDAPLREMLAKLSRGGHRIPLAGLRREDAGELLRTGFSIFLPDETLTVVHEGTGGNPFFLDEVARRFLAERQLREAAGGGLEVPEGLRAPIRGRLAGVAPGTRGLLALASVIGREFSFDLLVAAGGQTRETVLTALGELADLRFVDPAGFGLGPYRFVHALVREAIYQDLPAHDRWRLHLRVARAIEALHPSALESHVDQLAHHFCAASALGDPGPAIDYSVRAARRAARRLGFDEAVGHYRRALDLCEAAGRSPGDRFDLLLALGDVEWWAGHVAEAGETFRTAALRAREMQDPQRLADAALRVGEVGYGGAYMQAWEFDALKVELLEEALEAMGDEATPLRVRVAARLSACLYFSPFDSRERRDVLSRDAVAVGRRLGDDLTLAYALNARHLAVWGPDNLDERLAIANEIVQLATKAGDVPLGLTGRIWRLADLLEAGDVESADGEIEAYATLAKEMGYPQFVAHGYMVGATNAILRGAFADAEALAERVQAIAKQVGDANLQLSFEVQMGVLRALQGRPDDCVPYVEAAARKHPPELGRLVRNSILALAGASIDRREAAVTIRQAWDRTPPAFLVAHAVAGCWLAYRAGASDEMARLYEVLLPYGQRWALAGRDAVVCSGPVAYALGLAAATTSRRDAATEHFEAAIDASERAGARPFLVFARAAYGTMLAQSADGEDRRRAADLLTRAMTMGAELGMAHVCNEVEPVLAGLGPAPSTGAPVPEEPPGAAVFRREGEFWTVAYEGLVVRIKDAKGLRYLQRLLGNPGREFHVLDLAGGVAPAGGTAARDELNVAVAGSEPVLDSEAKAAYRARIDELRAGIDEAERDNDSEHAARARTELAFIVAELARATGLHGRDRDIASPAERARSSVTKSLRASLRRIETAHPALGEHLGSTVRTGYFCSYKPDPRVPVGWST